METSSSSNFSPLSIDVDIHKVPMLIPLPLQTTLSKVTKLKNEATLEEVLSSMKDYIFDHRLFDVKEPCIIHCDNDEIGKVLDVERFNLRELRKLLLKILVPHNHDYWLNYIAKNSVDANSKRKAEEIIELRRKKFCTSNESLSSANLATSSNSTSQGVLVHHEVQEVVSSDSDDSDDSIRAGDIFAIERTYEVEYEVATDSSANSSDASDTDTDSEVEVMTFTFAGLHMHIRMYKTALA